MGKKTTMNFLQKTRALEVLREHCTGDGTQATYADGYDDAKVATEITERLGFPCSQYSILGLRRDVFGNLGQNKPPAELSARVKALEGQVTELLAWKTAQEGGAK